jgi:hypothetical protein
MGAKPRTPGDLQSIADKTQVAKVQEQFDQAKKEEQERRGLHDAFMTWVLHPEVMERVNRAIRRAAEQGLREVQVLTFPASYCNDGDRRINNAEPDWPESLEGFAKRAYEFFTREPKPLGYKARADRRLSRRKARRRWALTRLVAASPGPVSGGDR